MTDKLKILNIIGQKPGNTGSGVFLQETISGFNRLGIKQAVVCATHAEDKQDFPKAVKIYPVQFQTSDIAFPIVGMSDEMPYKSTKFSDMTKEQTKVYKAAFLAKIKQAVEELRPNVILCHHLYLLTSFVREAYPKQVVIGFSHGSDLRQINKNPLNRNYVKEQIKKLDGIFALHDEHKEMICNIYEYNPDKIAVTGVGYNQNIFCRDAQIKKYDKKTLIFAGKLSEKKGVMSLLNSLKYMKYQADELVLKLAGGYGNEQEYQEIHKLSKEMSYEVEFLGMLTQQELAGEFRKSQVFVLPSFFEGLPLVIVEAMACGATIVATDLPGVKNWLDINAPGAQIKFVEPPKRVREDEPVKEDLERFERELASALEKMLEIPQNKNLDVSRISWSGMSKRVYEHICDFVKK